MKTTRQFTLKLAILALALVALMIIFSNDVVPHVPKLTVLAYTVGTLCALAACLFTVIVVKAGINQYVLNRGGIDTAWLWFGSNPQGLNQVQSSKE